MTVNPSLRNVRALTPDGLVDDAVVVTEAGRIVEVGRGTAPAGAVDGRGRLLLPALVDVHSDGLERERTPRRGVEFPIEFTLIGFEGRVRAAGISTVFHGIGFENKAQYGRSLDLAEQVCTAIATRRALSDASVDHRLLARTEARSTTGVDPTLPWIETFTEEIDGELTPPLLSFEDHTPGQGQYRDIEQYRKTVDPSELAPGETVDSVIERRMAEADALVHLRGQNRDRLAVLAAENRIRLLAHDCETPDEVAEAQAAGARIAEFPLTVDAAARARELGMAVVMGAPNALRGTSHSGNASATEVVAAGLCDALASDYLPATLLAGAFELARRGACDLASAVGLVTSGPARMAGLTDRGAIEPGLRADLVLIEDSGRWPEVIGRWQSASRSTVSA